MSNAILANQRQLFGHPLGLYVCFFTEMWERFAFYGLKALLFLYLTKHHAFSDNNGYLLLGTYAGLAYALPVVGGLLADQYLGMRKAVTFGGILDGRRYVGNGLYRSGGNTRRWRRCGSYSNYVCLFSFSCGGCWVFKAKYLDHRWSFI